MKKLKILLLFILLTLQLPSFAADQKPSAASIRELMEVVEIRKMHDTVMKQTDVMLHQAMQASVKGKKLSADEQKIIDKMNARLLDLVKQSISWEWMEQFCMNAYREWFTQKEVNDMLVFYRTPSGQSVIRKMPAMMATVMREIQGRIEAMKPGLAIIIRETLQEIQAAKQRKQMDESAPGIISSPST